MKLKKYFYSICLGIGLNMLLPEYKQLGCMEELKSKYHN